MMKRYLVITLLLLPFLITAQDDTGESADSSQTDNIDIERPVQSVETPMFTLKHESFNKKTDTRGRGELLQVEFQLYNNTDTDLNLYIFVFATEEKLTYRYDSFGKKRLGLADTEILYFEALPANEELYTYETEDGESQLVKYPNDVTKGVNPDTGKPYLLRDTYAFRTAFLSDYRKDFTFFNHVTILIFDADDDKLVYRQIWKLDGTRK